MIMLDKMAAVKLINDLVAAEVELVKEENLRSHGATKRALREEQEAVKALFKALTGQYPEPAEISEMVTL